jgi:hypothetical protein
VRRQHRLLQDAAVRRACTGGHVLAALNAAGAGMWDADRALDAAAAQVARDTASAVNGLSSASTTGATTPARTPATGAKPMPAGGPGVGAALPGDDLITAMPNLLVARESFAANAAVARQADEAYRAALDLLSDPS